MVKKISHLNKYLFKPKYWMLIILLFGVSLLGFWQYKEFSNNHENTPANINSVTPETTPTHDASSEGSDITIPKDVPSSSIRNYELITENEQYKIRYNGDSYLITLYAIINRPDQYSYYQDQLREYKQNALNYLKSKNIDVNKVKINYEPKEAEDL